MQVFDYIFLIAMGLAALTAAAGLLFVAWVALTTIEGWQFIFTSMLCVVLSIAGFVVCLPLIGWIALIVPPVIGWAATVLLAIASLFYSCYAADLISKKLGA